MIDSHKDKKLLCSSSFTGWTQCHENDLYVSDQEKSVPDVTSFPTCQDLASGDECVTLWTDSEGNPASHGYENILRDLDTSTRQSAPINVSVKSKDKSNGNSQFNQFPRH